MTSVAPVALVNGAGSGIGRGIEERLANDGHRVACLGRCVETLPSGAISLPIAADVGDVALIERAVATIGETWSRIDGVVRAVGVMRAARLDAITAADLELQLAAHVFGTLRTIRVAPPLLQVSHGSVVTISSTLNVLDESFAALDALTRSIMQERLLSIWSQERRAILVLTHDIDEAIFLSDRVLSMSVRPGRIRNHSGVALAQPRGHRMITAAAFDELKQFIHDEIYEERLLAGSVRGVQRSRLQQG